MASRPTPIRPGRFLPRDPRLDAPYRLTPQLVFRIGILGFLTLAVFAILFFRLWALQVLSGNQYLVAAAEQPAARHTHRGAAWAGRGSLRPRARRQHERHGDSGLAGRPAQARPVRRDAPPGEDPRGPAGGHHARDQEEPRRPGDAGHRPRRRQRERGPLPARAPVGVPGHDDHEHVRPELPVRRSRVAHPRLRRRDLAGPVEVEQGLRARRQGRPGRDRVFVRQGAARAAGPGAAAGRLARAADRARSRCGRRSLPAMRSGSRSTRSSSRRPSRRSSTGSTSRRRTTSGTRRRARSSPSTRAMERSGPSPRTRPSTRRHSRATRRAPSIS